MKGNALLPIVFLASIATTATISWKTKTGDGEKMSPHQSSSNPDSRPIIALRKVKAKAGVSTAAFETWAATLPHNEHGKIPGARFYVAKGERGDETGTYLFVIEFDSKRTRNFYYPTAGADSTKISADARRLLQPWNKIVADFEKVGEGVQTGKESYTDYVILQ